MAKGFLSRAVSLGFWTLLLRVGSTAFGVWLSNAVGAEGTGLYQLVLSVYMLAVTFSTSGVTIAVTRIVSEYYIQNNEAGMRRAFCLGLTFAASLGTLASLLLYVLSPFAAQYWLCDLRAAVPLRIFSFGLPFLSSASVIRGYFLGRQRTFLSVSGDVVEQIVTAAITAPLVLLWRENGIEGICTAMVIGSVSAEILSCIYAALTCLSVRTKKAGIPPRGIGRRILSITFPVAVGNNVRALLTAAENILTPAGLRKYGADSAGALAQYGVVKGMVWPILFLPTVLLSPVSSLLVPEISAADAMHDTARVQSMTHRCLKAALLYAFGAAGIIWTFAPQACALLFPEAENAAFYLRLLCPLIPLLYLDQIVDSILKGLDQQKASMRYNMADAAMRVALVFFLVPRYGIFGWIFMLYAGTIFNASLSAMRLIKVSRVVINVKSWVIRPVAAIVFSCTLASAIPVNAAVSAAGALLCYIGSLYLSTRRKAQLRRFPFQKKCKKNEKSA